MAGLLRLHMSLQNEAQGDEQVGAVGAWVQWWAASADEHYIRGELVQKKYVAMTQLASLP